MRPGTGSAEPAPMSLVHAPIIPVGTAIAACAGQRGLDAGRAVIVIRSVLMRKRNMPSAFERMRVRGDFDAVARIRPTQVGDESRAPGVLLDKPVGGGLCRCGTWRRPLILPFAAKAGNECAMDGRAHVSGSSGVKPESGSSPSAASICPRNRFPCPPSCVPPHGGDGGAQGAMPFGGLPRIPDGPIAPARPQSVHEPLVPWHAGHEQERAARKPRVRAQP